eukprot:4644699-Prymnesium_polylepis.2
MRIPIGRRQTATSSKWKRAPRCALPKARMRRAMLRRRARHVTPACRVATQDGVTTVRPAWTSVHSRGSPCSATSANNRPPRPMQAAPPLDARRQLRPPSAGSRGATRACRRYAHDDGPCRRAWRACAVIPCWPAGQSRLWVSGAARGPNRCQSPTSRWAPFCTTRRCAAGLLPSRPPASSRVPSASWRRCSIARR